jgi:hypothetical protein
VEDMIFYVIGIEIMNIRFADCIMRQGNGQLPFDIHKNIADQKKKKDDLPAHIISIGLNIKILFDPD